MWKYNLSSNCVEEHLDEGCYSMKNKLDKIPVSGKVEWIDGQELVEGKHFYLKYGNGGYSNTMDKPPQNAIPLPRGIILPKEHKSDIDDKSGFYGDIGEYGVVKPVSSDIEQEAQKDAKNRGAWGSEVFMQSKYAFQAGAEWMKTQSLTSNGDGVETVLTIGQIIYKQILLHELNPDVVEREIGLYKGCMNKIMNDEIYTNSIPIKLFRNLILSLHIPLSKIESAMLPTFKVVLSKETEKTIMKKPSHYVMYENEEATIKYLNRLKELL